ncbi:hypothetical protein SPRG_11407, partial [Saprolegnia parasitica CBS 223.65]
TSSRPLERKQASRTYSTALGREPALFMPGWDRELDATLWKARRWTAIDWAYLTHISSTEFTVQPVFDTFD